MLKQISKTDFKTPDIVCGGCANSIKNALGKLEGIKDVEVDIDSKIVSVEHDGQRISREEIETVLDDIGFPIES